MPPDQILATLMFAGMIAFLFFGFPVAFSLTFTGLFFGALGVPTGSLRPDFFDILPLRIWGTIRTSPCWPFRCSCSWGWCWRNRDWPRNCWRPWPCSSASCGAASPSRWWWSAPSWRRPPASWAPASSPWASSPCRPCCAGATTTAHLRHHLRLRHPRPDHPAQRHPGTARRHHGGVGRRSLHRGRAPRAAAGRPLYHLHRGPGPPAAGAGPRRFPTRSCGCSGRALKRVTIALIPAFALIVGVLGSIFAGIATPTEAASVGAVGGLVLTMIKGRFSCRCCAT